VVREIRPDLTLLDWWLPGAVGLTFARQMRGDRRTAHVSIIAVSARSEEHDRIAALESGADDYITKPFSMRELLARIKAVMRRRTPQLADDVVCAVRRSCRARPSQDAALVDHVVLNDGAVLAADAGI
jgi:two-component system, OmpR family, phosphate regulon response regulator PhoB